MRIELRTVTRTALTCCLLLLVSACAAKEPVYKLVPPASGNGQACAATCENAHRTCQQKCTTESKTCRTMTMPGLGGFRVDGSYASGSFGTTGVDGHAGEICSVRLCEESCKRTYHQCYEGCGGQVRKF